MTLADFFLAINAAGINSANVSGQLQLRGPTNAISLEIKAGAAEHKAAIIALLPPVPSLEVVAIEITRDTLLIRPDWQRPRPNWKQRN
jgi:hypothetical protein